MRSFLKSSFPYFYLSSIVVIIFSIFVIGTFLNGSKNSYSINYNGSEFDTSLKEYELMETFKRDMNSLFREREQWQNIDFSGRVVNEQKWSERIIDLLKSDTAKRLELTPLLQDFKNLKKIVVKTDKMFLNSFQIEKFEEQSLNLHQYISKNRWKRLKSSTAEFNKKWEKIRAELFIKKIPTLRNWKILLQRVENRTLASNFKQRRKESILEKLFLVREKSNHLGILVGLSNEYIDTIKRIGIGVSNLKQGIIINQNQILEEARQLSSIRVYALIMLLCASLYFVVMSFIKGKKILNLHNTIKEIKESKTLHVIDENIVLKRAVGRILSESIKDLSNNYGDETIVTTKKSKINFEKTHDTALSN